MQAAGGEKTSKSYPVSYSADLLVRCAHWCNRGMNTLWVTNQFLTGDESASQDKIHDCKPSRRPWVGRMIGAERNYYCYLAKWPLQPNCTLNAYVYSCDLCCSPLPSKKFLFAAGSFNAETLLLVKALRMKTSQCQQSAYAAPVVRVWMGLWLV